MNAYNNLNPMKFFFRSIDGFGEQEMERCLKGLPSGVVEHVREMHHLQGQRERVAAYLLLVEALNELGLFVEMPIVAHTASGKPFLANYPGVCFSQSHCRRGVAVALSTEGEVGIDIECRRKVSESLVERVCNESERKQVAQSEDPELEFVRLWTRKESVVKCLGTGIQDYMQDKESEAQRLGLRVESFAVEEIEGWVSVCF